MKRFCMRGDFMKRLKGIQILLAIALVVAALGGCVAIKPQAPDKDGMVYKDADYRSIYANVFDFDSLDTQPMFAVAFLGYGDRMEFRHPELQKEFYPYSRKRNCSKLLL